MDALGQQYSIYRPYGVPACCIGATFEAANGLRDDVETWERIIYRRVLAALLIPVQLSSVQALKVPNLRAILDVDDVPLPSRTSLVSGIAGYLSGKANGNLYSVVIGVDELQSLDERVPRQPAGSGRLVMRVLRELQHEVYLQAPNVMLLPLGTGICADVFDSSYGAAQCIETNTHRLLMTPDGYAEFYNQLVQQHVCTMDASHAQALYKRVGHLVNN